MRIVNPRSSVNNTPLATTWYVDTQLDIAKDELIENIEAVSGNLQNKIEAEATERNLQDRAVAAVIAKQLTGKQDIPDDIAQEVFTKAEDEYLGFYQDKFHPEGYAWLKDNKLDPALLPDLSIITPVPVNRSTIFTWFTNSSGLDNGGELSDAIKDLTEEEQAKYIVQEFVCKTGLREDGTSNLDPGYTSPYIKTGDMVIVNPDDDENLYTTGTKRPYFGKRYICGAWSVINNEPLVKASLVKISFNQGEITKVNEKFASQDGSVHIGLADVYRYTEDETGMATSTLIGESLAHDILAISAMPVSAYNEFTDPSSIPGLLPDGVRLGYRQRHGVASDEYIPYATLKELADLYTEVNNVIKTEISGLNSDIDAISAIIGDVTSSALSAKTIADAIDEISGKTVDACEHCDTISAALDGKAVQIMATQVTWASDQAAESFDKEEFNTDLYPDGDKIIKLTFGSNNEIPGKILAVYEVDNTGLETVVQPEITYYPASTGLEHSVIATFTYNADAASIPGGGYESAISKTWKIYFTKEILF